MNPDDWMAVGLMSGTSADGITAAVTRLRRGKLRLLHHHTFPYPNAFRARLLSSSPREFGELNVQLGELLAEAAVKALHRARVNPARVAVIGSHGHTVGHAPHGKVPWTLQIGEPSVIAERTGITTVADFRPRDIAAGGEGAPLVPVLDRFLFGSGSTVAVLNIGGIANVTVVGRAVRSPLAFDTGPGNCLMDLAVSEVGGKLRYDRDGRRAARGVVDESLVRRMLSHPYFSRRPPKSTGRDLFRLEFLPPPLRKMVRTRPADTLATLNVFTARSIALAYRQFILPKFSIKHVIVSGGGVYNRTLMQNLRKFLHPVPVSSSMAYGVHPMAKEAMAFALLAIEAVRGRDNNVPSATGARRAVIMGKIVPGKNFKRIELK